MNSKNCLLFLTILLGCFPILSFGMRSFFTIIWSCLGIYLLKDELTQVVKPQIALTSHQMDFYLPVLPNEKVTVTSEKEVFRFNKLKCKVKLFNEKGELVCRGSISGMLHIPAQVGISDS